MLAYGYTIEMVDTFNTHPNASIWVEMLFLTFTFGTTRIPAFCGADSPWLFPRTGEDSSIPGVFWRSRENAMIDIGEQHL